MGSTYVNVVVSNPADWQKSEEVRLPVDTGAIVSVIPRKILQGLEVKSLGKRKIRAFGGQHVERETGGVLVKYDEAQAVVPVAFGEEKDDSVLGATALEALGYEVDPVTKQLKPVELLLL